MVLGAIQTVGAWYYRIRGIGMFILGIIAVIVGAILTFTDSFLTGIINNT